MPVVYTSQDASAPVLTNDKSAFNNLLKIVLTQGYGDKPSAGWTLEFEDTDNDIVAFRNAGTGYFLRFAYSVSGDIAVNSYESMTDVNNGTNPSETYHINYYQDLTTIEWAIVGDNKSFYFYTNNHLYFFGDFPSFVAGELWNFAIGGTYSKNIRCYGDTSIDVIRKMTGEQTHTYLEIKGNPFGSYYFGGEDNAIAYPYYGNVFIAKPVLFESSKPRGVLCGLTDFKHKKDDLTASINIDKWAIKEVESVNYIFFETQYGTAAIDLDNWWSIK